MFFFSYLVVVVVVEGSYCVNLSLDVPWEEDMAGNN